VDSRIGENPISLPESLEAIDRVDDRSEKVIATLLPEVQPYARALVTRAAQHGITIKVIRPSHVLGAERIFQPGPHQTWPNRCQRARWLFEP
jgi:hypothetical protein